MLYLWLIFLASALAVILAGYKLGQYGDEIADITGIEGAWIGLLLLATVTSLPELATTATAGAIEAPQIALGNIFGSNLFNMLLIVLMDFIGFWLLKRQSPPLLARVREDQLLYATSAIILTTVSIAGMGLGGKREWGHLGLFSWALLVLYPIGVRLLYRPPADSSTARISLDWQRLAVPLGKFALASAIVIVAGVFLARSGKAITLNTGLTGTFMGAVFIAASTSLPELMSCLGALRVGADDLLVGNLFGSNMFNTFTIPFADIVYSGNLLAAGGRDQITIAAFSVILMAIAAFGIQRRSSKRVLGIGWESVALLIVYSLSISILVQKGIGF
jgi:cation:H+ antiporter